MYKVAWDLFEPRKTSVPWSISYNHKKYLITIVYILLFRLQPWLQIWQLRHNFDTTLRALVAQRLGRWSLDCGVRDQYLLNPVDIHFHSYMYSRPWDRGMIFDTDAQIGPGPNCILNFSIGFLLSEKPCYQD